MAFSLIPREEKFFDLLEEAALNAHKTAITFKGLTADWQVNSPKVREIRDLEHEGDSITHEIFDKLNRTFVTPLDREDINALASELDEVVDLINSTTSRLNLYKIEVIEKELLEQSDILEQAAASLLKAVKSLRNIKNSRRVLDYCIEVDRLENEGDRVTELALSRLFLNHKEPVEIIKWKEIFEIVEMAIDKCEDASNAIESIIVKHG